MFLHKTRYASISLAFTLLAAWSKRPRTHERLSAHEVPRAQAMRKQRFPVSSYSSQYRKCAMASECECDDMYGVHTRHRPTKTGSMVVLKHRQEVYGVHAKHRPTQTGLHSHHYDVILNTSL